MARERKPRPEGPTDYIDETGRQAILAQMRTFTPNKTKADIARECKVTPSAVTLLLKDPIPRGKVRGVRFGRELEKCLGMIGIVKTGTPNAKDELTRRALKVLRELRNDPKALENWLTNGELFVDLLENKP